MAEPKLGILLGLKPKKADAEAPEDDEEELPDGLVEAVGEFRSAESDEDAAQALMNAVRLCS